jgi:hypothetical protein
MFFKLPQCVAIYKWPLLAAVYASVLEFLVIVSEFESSHPDGPPL